MHNDSIIIINPKDNVGTVKPGGRSLSLSIPSGHKVAVRDIKDGEVIYRYGQPIGKAIGDIGKGEHVHVHNLKFARVEGFLPEHKSSPVLEEYKKHSAKTFQGYKRSNGRAGTRNYIAVISTVNCSATVCQAIAAEAVKRNMFDKYPNIDGIIPLTHGGGCSVNAYGTGYAYLSRVLAGYAGNPNICGVLFVGLGCETNHVDRVMKEADFIVSDRMRALNIQNCGGTTSTIEAALKLIAEMLSVVGNQEREPCSVSELMIALQCGGSDAFSGMSANPALGAAMDILVANGGTAILSETPEIYGAEHLLADRATNEGVSDRLMGRIKWWEEYASQHGAELDNNPSHGNKEGGLTNILEKSLGAICKGGTSPLSAVYEYAEPVKSHGLVFMDTPGNDAIGVTGQVAGGANLVCFTTGRGSTSGFKPAPCIKIASNSRMYNHMLDDMDINCGTIIDGVETIEQAGIRIYEEIIAVASGQKSRSEIHSYGNNEFVPWQLGAVM